MKTIDLRLLTELEDKKEFKLLGKYTFRKSPSSRRPLEIVRQLGSKAASKPKELLKELGISLQAGDNEYETVFEAVQQAINNNKTFAKFFPAVDFNSEVGEGVVIIRPVASFFSGEADSGKEIEFMHPDIYVAAIVLALQKVGIITNEIGSEPKKERNRFKRHIIQADSGEIIITDPNNLSSKNNITQEEE